MSELAIDPHKRAVRLLKKHAARWSSIGLSTQPPFCGCCAYRTLAKFRHRNQVAVKAGTCADNRPLLRKTRQGTVFADYEPLHLTHMACVDVSSRLCRLRRGQTTARFPRSTFHSRALSGDWPGNTRVSGSSRHMVHSSSARADPSDAGRCGEQRHS